MKHMEYVKELKDIVEFSTALYDDLYQESKYASYSTMMGLFASIIEYCSGLIVLFESKSYICTQPISRSVLEAYVDILNIKINGNYVNYLWAEYYNREKALEKSKSKKTQLRKKRNDRFKLYNEEESFEVLTISEKFKLANFKSEYNTLYPTLSANTHSGIFVLLNRIMEEGKENKLSAQNLFKSIPSVPESLSIQMVSYFLMDACQIIAKGHDEEALEKVKVFRELLVKKYS